MKKLGLLFFVLLYSILLHAQELSTPNFDQNNYPQFSINLYVLGKARSSADTFFDEGERFERVGDYKASAELFSKAATAYLHNKKMLRYGTALLRLSNAHLLANQYLKAEQIVLKQALRTFSRIGSKSGQMAAYQQLAKIYAASNKLTQSLWFYTQQGLLAQELHDSHSQIESMLGIANIKIRKKDYDLASKDLNAVELLCKNTNTQQYSQQIKQHRAVIAEKTQSKKG